jgi:hypothetical protein
MGPFVEIYVLIKERDQFCRTKFFTVKWSVLNICLPIYLYSTNCRSQKGTSPVAQAIFITEREFMLIGVTSHLG